MTHRTFIFIFMGNKCKRNARQGTAQCSRLLAALRRDDTVHQEVTGHCRVRTWQVSAHQTLRSRKATDCNALTTRWVT